MDEKIEYTDGDDRSTWPVFGHHFINSKTNPVADVAQLQVFEPTEPAQLMVSNENISSRAKPRRKSTFSHRD